jgi:predicted Fe-Mo cluster-binding NifX family protein
MGTFFKKSMKKINCIYSFDTVVTIFKVREYTKCAKIEIKIWGGKEMKIAVTMVDNQISPHFGGSEKVCIYTVEDNKVAKKEYFDMPEHRSGLFAKFIKEKGVDVVITGAMGERARYIFDTLGIKYFIGILGNPNEAVEKLLKGELKTDEELAKKIHEQGKSLHHEHHH